MVTVYVPMDKNVFVQEIYKISHMFKLTLLHPEWALIFGHSECSWVNMSVALGKMKFLAKVLTDTQCHHVMIHSQQLLAITVLGTRAFHTVSMFPSENLVGGLNRVIVIIHMTTSTKKILACVPSKA